MAMAPFREFLALVILDGDFDLPQHLSVDPAHRRAQPLGKYGRLRRRYLQEHRPGLYSRLVLSEKLFPHLRGIDETVIGQLYTSSLRMISSACAFRLFISPTHFIWSRAFSSSVTPADFISSHTN